MLLPILSVLLTPHLSSHHPLLAHTSALPSHWAGPTSPVPAPASQRPLSRLWPGLSCPQTLDSAFLPWPCRLQRLGRLHKAFLRHSSSAKLGGQG